MGNNFWWEADDFEIILFQISIQNISYLYVTLKNFQNIIDFKISLLRNQCFRKAHIFLLLSQFYLLYKKTDSLKLLFQ